MWWSRPTRRSGAETVSPVDTPAGSVRAPAALRSCHRRSPARARVGAFDPDLGYPGRAQPPDQGPHPRSVIGGIENRRICYPSGSTTDTAGSSLAQSTATLAGPAVGFHTARGVVLLALQAGIVTVDGELAIGFGRTVPLDGVCEGLGGRARQSGRRRPDGGSMPSGPRVPGPYGGPITWLRQDPAACVRWRTWGGCGQSRSQDCVRAA